MYDAIDFAEVASRYYNGQFSAMYAYISTYTIEFGLIREIKEAISIAEKHYPDDLDILYSFLKLAEDNVPADDNE